jgi:DNA-binding PadR family transcriptional regulator
MAYRKRGTLIALERAILDAAVRRAPDGVYGFALAQDLAGDSRTEAGLIAHGTLYKALDRLRRNGFLDARWEDAEAASAELRPRRRIYTVTAAGRQALAAAPAPAPRLAGEAAT